MNGGPDEPVVSPFALVAFALGLVIGYAVWAAAPAAIGHRAPWEGEWPYYSTVLITGSALVALLLPREYAAVFVGTALGQLFAKLTLLDSTDRIFLTLGRLDHLGAVLTLPGTWAGSLARDYFRRAA